MKLRNILHSDIITKILTTMKNTRERNRGMDRPNWGKDPFTKFRKQRGNPQIGQPPGLIPKKGYPIFGLALLALQVDYTRVLECGTMLRNRGSGQSCGTARTLKQEPCRLNGSNPLRKSQNRLSRCGRLRAGVKYLAGV